MDFREISTRLHDILRTAARVRQPGPGRTAEANIETIDEVKGGLRALIVDLGGQEPPRLPPRLRANAAAFPEGRIAGTRTTVQHRRRTRMATHRGNEAGTPRAAGAVVPFGSQRPDPPSARALAEAHFRGFAAASADAGPAL